LLATSSEIPKLQR